MVVDNESKGKESGNGDVEDQRILFCFDFVTKSLKVKPDKWNKMLLVEESRNAISNFLDSTSQVLVIHLNSSGTLVAESTFCSNPKTKIVYFTKTVKDFVPKSDVYKYLLSGSLSKDVLSQFSVFVENFLLTLIKKFASEKTLPEVVCKDIEQHLVDLRESTQQIAGAVKRKIILPLCLTDQQVRDAEKAAFHGDQEVDLTVKTYIEATVIKWTHRIKLELNKVFLISDENNISGPLDEIHYWNNRRDMLFFIYNQLRHDTIKNIAVILEQTNSVYSTDLKSTFCEVVASLEESEEICLYLNTLLPHIERIQSDNLDDAGRLLRPFFHVICLIWANTKYYTSQRRIAGLIQGACNMCVLIVQNFLDSSSLFRTEPVEALFNIEKARNFLECFRCCYERAKENILSFFVDKSFERPWSFNEDVVFCFCYIFLERLSLIEDVLRTALDYTRLEKIEVGGINGKKLSAAILQIFKQFENVYSQFPSKAYNVFDPNEDSFMLDYKSFTAKILDFDRRMSTYISSAFDGCYNSESVFKQLLMWGKFLNRDSIAINILPKYQGLLEMLHMDIDQAKLIFDKRIELINNCDLPPDRFLPPTASNLQWLDAIRKELNSLISQFEGLSHPIVQSKSACILLEKRNQFMKIIEDKGNSIFACWCSTSTVELGTLLRKHVLTRFEQERVAVNFHYSLASILKDVKCIKHLAKFRLSEELLEAEDNRMKFNLYRCNLETICETYNSIRRLSVPVELQLVKPQLEEVDKFIDMGTKNITWETSDLWDYITATMEAVNNLSVRVNKSLSNIKSIVDMLSHYTDRPLFERREERGNVLLAYEHMYDKNKEIYKALSKIDAKMLAIVKENKILFKAEGKSVEWRNYVHYIDDIVSKELRNFVYKSFEYLLLNTDEESNSSPFLEVKMNLVDSEIRFFPSMDCSHEHNFFEIMEDIMQAIFCTTKLINKLSRKKRQTTHMEDLKNDSVICSMQTCFSNRIQKAVSSCLDYSDSLASYSYLWLDDKNEFLAQFLKYGRQVSLDEMDQDIVPEKSPNLDDFRVQINGYEEIYESLQSIEGVVLIDGWLNLDCRPLKAELANTIRNWSNLFKLYLSTNVAEQLTNLQQFIIVVTDKLNAEVGEDDYEGLVFMMETFYEVKERQLVADSMFEPIRDTIDFLETYHVDLPSCVYDQLQTLPEKWRETLQLCSIVKQRVAPLQSYEVSKIKTRITQFEKLQFEYRKEFHDLTVFLPTCKDPFSYLDRVNKEISKMELELDKIVECALLFEVHVPEFKELQLCRREVTLVKNVWDNVLVINSNINMWKRTLWKNIDVEDMSRDCKTFLKNLRGLNRQVRTWEVYSDLESTMKNMLSSLKAVAELQNPAIRPRHWIDLMKATKVKFMMDDDTCLSDLLDLNLHYFEDEVMEIVDKAVKEISMEKVIRDLEETWNNMTFSNDVHSRTGLLLIRLDEELIETLEDNQSQLQTLLSSKHISFFLQEVTYWQKQLSLADQILNLWFEVQRTWVHLESIFIGSEDIRTQLCNDSKRFDEIDCDFRQLLTEMNSSCTVLEAIGQRKLHERLEYIQERLTLCEKALTDYLETKRLAFPRFYFVSSADLLDILSNGNQPWFVTRHLTKIFDSLSGLKFLEEGSKRAVGMFSKDGEYVQFNQPLDCEGPVEHWLNKLLDHMQSTIRFYMTSAVLKYEDRPREEWIFDYPAQVSLAGTQICWATEVNICFKRLEEGYENALKDYNKKQVSQLNCLIALLLGSLTKQQRQNVTTICTIDVHSRDMVSKLISSKVETAQSFHWQSQLRHRWDDESNDCYANICYAQFRYSHEYLGNTPRLVITPLTDRCYITLTQSLHLIMGGAPAGPAGTGKTETTKDLGRALGIMVYVFNCSEQMDYKSCGNIYKGLSQTGAWGCFDEFNRISVEVLSVVAVQVKCVQDAIRDKKQVFNFLGEEISNIPTVGMFITMNPGYAGRTELPENLKVLFRPCAMVVPDIELICEIMLVSEGFVESRLLARKFITLYTLCKELLSKQDHYDWGLRAVKSVLVVAGSLRRSDSDRPEDQVLMRALRDFNIPKIVSNDVPVFMGLIGDLFPALNVPRKRNSELEQSIATASLKLHLQPDDGFVLKVVQLQELLDVRHSVFIIGEAGTGKTQVWRTLFRTHLNMKTKPSYVDLNPKAVTNNELFGIINPATREWKDGLLSSLMRDQTNISSQGPKWIILDGDIDPMWIESLNTVMDDNKVLTLASNERIALTPAMRLIFEISNLRHATPATVSRAGILYINAQDLGWSPFVTSWIETRTLQSERSILIMLFDKYVPPCLEILHTKLKKITPIVDISHVQMLCSLLDCILISPAISSDSTKEVYELYFSFCCIWAFGAALLQDHTLDCKAEFSRWWLSEFKAVKFPTSGTVFDYYIDAESQKFLPWTNLVSSFELDIDVSLQSIQVPTRETTRLAYFTDLLIKTGQPTMLVGPSGTGKTVFINNLLGNLNEDFGVTRVPFNYYTGSETLQCVLEKPLEKKAGRNFGPHGYKKIVYFIDDINMPEVDLYDTVEAHALLRQFMDYSHWYDRQKMLLKDISNIQFVAAMNPTAGSFTINPRLQRHFAVFATSFPESDSLFTIYNSILSQHLCNSYNKFSKSVAEISASIVYAAFALQTKVSHLFLPTATKFHYVFNLKDISNVFQGILCSTAESVTSPTSLIRLWIHESQRVYADRFIDADDIQRFEKTLGDVVKKEFININENIVFQEPNIWSHFAKGLDELKYNQVDSWESLTKLLEESLRSYNEVNSVMDLVLFEDALMHICRINRIIESSRGNALLVGVGGSGKQSLSRLSAFMSGLEVFQISIRKGYSKTDLKTDIAALYKKAGLKGVGTMFLLTDAHITDETFLVLINDVLSSGIVPDLFSDDELEDVISSIRNEVKAAGIYDTRENCWNFFVEKVRRLLKVVLCFSPVGNTLRLRARRFPAIVSCTSINWFHEWPEEALSSVSHRFLKGLEVLPSHIPSLAARFMSSVHISVNAMSKLYLQNDRRYNYTTPKSFLEQISLYKKLLLINVLEIKEKILRLEDGLEKLRSTGAQVDELKDRLAKQELELKEKNDDADKLINIVGKETLVVTSEKEIAYEEELKVNVINEEVTKKQRECEEDLKKAEPALLASVEALNTLNKNNLTELKSFGAPPPAVVKVTQAVMVLLAPKGKIPKDKSWKACKVMMAKVDQFLEKLKKYDKKNIHPECIKAINSYLNDPEFNPEFIKSKSLAAAGLCAWVINIIRFYEIYCEVEPKRLALEKANGDLSAAQEKLVLVKERVLNLEKTLQKLRSDYEAATSAKLKCQKEAENTALTIDLANRLVNGLSSENVRWAQSVENLRRQENTIPGDILLLTAFLSYAGCFTKAYRIDLFFKIWRPEIEKIGIPITEGLDPLTLLTDEAQMAKWSNEGLPNDRMSVENATILLNSDRWPLMIDPQLQGVKWIKKKYGSSLKVIRLNQKGHLDVIENAVSNGDVTLIENIGESLDPVLDSLLSRNLINKGRSIRLGDKEVTYNSKFRLILQTKLANPHYKPELQAQTTLINFAVTKDGLEDQILADVVKVERPDLEEQKLSLTRQQNEFKIMLKSLEDNLLFRLSNASGDFLGDVDLVENLENTKQTAAEVEGKVAAAKDTSIRIDQTRELYRPAAARASLLYFILNDLHIINPMYQFSLKAFNIVFQKSILNAEQKEKVEERVECLMDCITFSIYSYTTRGLFECDKLIFSAQMVFQILLLSNQIEYSELDFLLRFPVSGDVSSPVDFLTDRCWQGVKTLSVMDHFLGLDKDIEGSSKRWKSICESECPEKEKFPQDWKNKTSLQKLCVLRALRPDRMLYAIRSFIEEKMGYKYVEGRSVKFSKSYQEMDSMTPIFFILSPGVDPLKDVEKLGRKLTFTADNKKFHNVSLGQGQEIVAERAMELASRKGHWVILQNIHLVKSWLPQLEKKIEETTTNCHKKYRVFMSGEPAPNADSHIIPQGILESAIKITNEPPTGMHANIHKALDNFSQETLEMCTKEIEFKSVLFSLCYFHAVVAERRKFGSQGWNRSYPFNVGDLTISVNVLYNYLESNSSVPWEDLRYLFGEIMYGGHITDDWDRRLCKTYLEVYIHPDQLEGELNLAPGFPCPPNLDYQGYHSYIDANLPTESPYLYGLHPNAEIGFLTTTSENLFRTVLDLQPRVVDGGGEVITSREDRIKQKLDDLLEKLPDAFNIAELFSKVEERSPYTVVALQECERMNILNIVVRKSLEELNLGLKGELSVTNEMEELGNALFVDSVPNAWHKYSYPSMHSLSVWFADLLMRIRELESWTSDFNLPTSVWLGGLFNPQSFLTAIMQTTARKMEWPLDKMCLQCDITKKFREDFSSAPREGAYLNGFFMEGARWDTVSGSIMDSRLKELFATLPVIYIKALTQDKRDTKNIYGCPLYRTRLRGPTYVWTFNLKTRESCQKWVLAGVALLLQI